MSGKTTTRYLLWVVSLQAELAWYFAPGELAAVEIHTPGAAEGKGSAARVGVQTLTRTCSAAEMKERMGDEEQK